MNNQQTNNWYDKPWLVYTLCILLFPVGLYALWKSNQLSKNNKTIGFLLVLAVVLAAVLNSDTKTPPEIANTKQTSIQSKETNKKIPGLNPADIYHNLEKQDFAIDKRFSSEYGNTWDCKKSYAGIDYLVNIYNSDNVTTVENVRVTVTLNGLENKEIIATKPFLNYMCTIPYNGSDPKKISEWLNKNFNNDKESIIISNVKFTIYAPTKFLRMIDISPI